MRSEKKKRTPAEIADEIKALSGHTVHDTFKDVMSGKEKTVRDWKAELKAHRDLRSGTTGSYNPKTGERSYGAFHRGPKKDMRGRRYSG